MPSIVVRELAKDFTKVVKAPGLAGSLKALFRPTREVFHAVQRISFEIEQGEIVGFLGPNGAGKTTTLKMLSGILAPTSGSARVLGYDPFRRDPAYLSQIALVMGNRQQLWWDLPAMDSFLVLKELYGVGQEAFQSKLDRLLPALDLKDKVNTQVRKMSLGERMKCELVACLLHDPKVVFLDEPTIGLDVTSQQRIRTFLLEYQQETRCSIILTSHYMQDVEELCQRVLVINHGQLVFEGKIDALAAAHSQDKRLRLAFGHLVETGDLNRFGRVLESDGATAVMVVPKSDAAKVTAALLEALPVIDINIEDPPIEEVIAALYEKGAKPALAEAAGGLSTNEEQAG